MDEVFNRRLALSPAAFVAVNRCDGVNVRRDVAANCPRCAS